MVLPDTSIWIDHIRSDIADFRALLDAKRIVNHPFVTLELALGFVPKGRGVLRLVELLPVAPVARIGEVRVVIDRHGLQGRGIGLTDVHLVASSLLKPGLLLWTRDKRLRKVAEALGIHADLD